LTLETGQAEERLKPCAVRVRKSMAQARGNRPAGNDPVAFKDGEQTIATLRGYFDLLLRLPLLGRRILAELIVQLAGLGVVRVQAESHFHRFPGFREMRFDS
jgi:hypothetical protein